MDLDADALQFLQDLEVDELVADVADVTSVGTFGHLLAAPLELPALAPLLQTSPHRHDALSPTLADATAALEISPLDFFPPSDNDDNGDRVPKGAAKATKAPLKAKRKKPNRSPNYDPNRARNMRRHELIYLRGKVAEMEKELTRLRDTTALQLVAQAPAPPAVMESPSTLIPSNSGPSAGATMWERIAARQLSERQRAERENERLKIVLEAQLKIAKSLEHLLHKRSAMQGFDDCGLNRQRRVFANISSQSDKDTFQSLLDEVHDTYLNADTHFHNFGIGASEASCRDARIRDAANESGIFMEIFANDVLPFPVQAAGKAAWHYFSHYKNKLPFRLYYERISEIMDLPEDTIAENSGLELQVNNTKAIFNLKQVIRRYVEADRVVVAYSAIAQPVEFANKPIWGFDFREWGCMVLKKPVTLDAEGYSVLKSCYFITPSFHGNAGASGDDGDERDRDERAAIIGDLTEFTLSSTAATMGAWLQMIENILVVEQAGTAAPPR